MKFTDEPEVEKTIPFLDAQVTRKEDGTLKMKIYRKKTHTEQYFNLDSHHPLPNKLGLVRTLYERDDNIIMEPEDQRQEIIHSSNALGVCGYSDWSFKEMRKRVDNRKTKQQKEERRKKQKEKSA